MMGWFVVAFAVWAVGHSVLASRRVKEWVRVRVGERPYTGWYRLVYNVVAALSFVPVLWLMATAVPPTPVWSMPAPFSWLAVLVQLVGLVGLTISLYQTDFLSFVGITQAVDYLQGRGDEEKRPSALVTTGPYAWVRHPLYFFSLLVLWFSPIMNLNSLLFNLLATVYFGIGSKYEERRLQDEFGSAYTAYKAKVPYLFPFPRPRNT